MHKYEELMKYIQDKYLSKNENQTRRLPSIRELASAVNCSRNSVIRAYEELEQKHQIYCIPQSGYYVMDENTHTETQETVIDFVTANPDQRALPYRAFSHCMNRAVDIYRDELFLYPEAQGFLPLRKALANMLTNRQVHTNTEQICITNGVQQAISVLFGMKEGVPKEKTTIVLEMPGYPLATVLATQNNLQVQYVERTEEGLDCKQLEEYFATGTIQYFYLMPRFHNPTGASLSVKQKKKVVELAAKYQVYLIEDDYLAELDSDVERLSLHYYDTANRVIYLAGFSKSFMPGLRIGAAILPKELVNPFLQCKYPSDLGTSTYLQGTLTMYLTNGMYSHHCQRIRAIYRDKMIHFQRIYARYKERIKANVVVPESGYYLWITFRKEFGQKKEQLLVTFLKKQGVLVTAGSSYYSEDRCDQAAIRICISNCTMEELEKGATILFENIEMFEKK